LYSPFTLARKYAQYWLSSSNGRGHGVHSPFVFDFIIHVLQGKQQDVLFAPIESCRQDLLHNKQYIEVEDFGAGSGIIKTNRRRVDKIAASSLKPKKYARLLHRMIAYYKPEQLIELGTSFGITSMYLASGNPHATLHTFEGSTAIGNLAQHHFNKIKAENIHLHSGEFGQTFQPFISSATYIDFAFIDGNHRKAPTLDYFNLLLKKLTPDGIIVFDDIHWSEEMEAAWEDIKNHPSVTLSIDLFFIGIAFINPDFKTKQHFSVRF